MYRTHHPTHHPGSHVPATCQRCGVELRDFDQVEQRCLGTSLDLSLLGEDLREAGQPELAGVVRAAAVVVRLAEVAGGQPRSAQEHIDDFFASQLRATPRRCIGCHRTREVARANPCTQCEVPR